MARLVHADERGRDVVAHGEAEDGEAAGDDARFFPFGLQTNVDDRYAAFDQFLELGIVDVDDFSLGEVRGGEEADNEAGKEQAAHGESS